MDELRSHEQTTTISLDVQDQQDMFDGKTSDQQDAGAIWLQGKSSAVSGHSSGSAIAGNSVLLRSIRMSGISSCRHKSRYEDGGQISQVSYRLSPLANPERKNPG
jgi:hypothetical protein